MWILFAAGSAVFAALTGILAKIGVRSTDSNTATAVRTGVVLLFSWVLVFLTGEYRELSLLRDSPSDLVWILLSGLATGASWLCYFHAIKLGSVNRVAPIDKSSALLTVLASFVLFHEAVTPWKIAG
ncbi:MAG: EamA family transporter, partial [Oscillospiraceae bacterium]